MTEILDVFFYEAFEEEEIAIRSALPDGIAAGFTWKTIQEAGHATAPARVISTRTQSAIPEVWATELEAILSRSTGYDHLKQYLAATDNRVHCGYLPLYCNRSVAEQALLLWLALMRKLPLQQAQFSRFHRDGLTGRETQGQHLLVTGVGNIGYEVVKIGRGLDMNVTGVDIDPRHDDVTYRSIGEALPQADVIVCAMNLTPENTGYFDYKRLKQAPEGALFVNIARGEMSPSADLLKLIDEGHLGGVGLDVYDNEGALATRLRGEPVEMNKEIEATLALHKRENVILTPHNAFNTEESVFRKAEQSVEQLDYFFKQGRFKWVVT